MIDEIYKFWNITPEYIFSDEFTGYEDLYPEFDKHTKETYERDPDGTINAVFTL